MKLSSISTGDKLKYKTFGELQPGDKMYWTCSAVDDIKNTAFTVTGKKKSSNRQIKCYTNLNPDERVETLCDILLDCKDYYGYTTYGEVPSGAAYITYGSTVFATSQELLLQVIDKYNIESQLK